MNPSFYHRPLSLDNALALLAQERCAVLAGGTDFYPARVGRPVTGAVLDITALTELRGIAQQADGGWRIGTLTTWSDLVRTKGVTPGFGAMAHADLFAGLIAAAREIGGVQIQNQGTVGGNLCNASPAADGVPVLMAMDASVELRSDQGVRSLSLEHFVQGNRRTALRSDELLTAITIPPFSARGLTRFSKLGHRRYLVISIAMLAIALDFDENQRLQRCGIAVGSCAAVARRLPLLEARLLSTARAELGARMAELLSTDGPPDSADEPPASGDSWLAVLAPIDDVRGTAVYRQQAVREMLRRIFDGVADEG